MTDVEAVSVKAASDLVDLVAFLSYVAHHSTDGPKRVGIVTFKRLRDRLARFADQNPETGETMIEHFGNLRGSNKFVGVGMLIVTGTPQPPAEDVRRIAACVLFDRTEAFSTERSTKLRPYRHRLHDGTGLAYPVPGYWHDDDLQAILEQFREAELVQAVNRARGVLRDPDDPVDVWMLANLPVDGLPPEEIVSIKQAFCVPEPGIDPYSWGKFLVWADARYHERGVLAARDVAEALGVNRKTANRYVEILMRTRPGEWSPPEDDEKIAFASGRRGRPSILAVARYG